MLQQNLKNNHWSNDMNVVTMRNTIRDSMLMGININYTKDDIDISIRLKKHDVLWILKIQQVESYKINSFDQHGYRYIESIKIIETTNDFYVSLDPYDETSTPHENDNDRIIAKFINLTSVT
jgi:hypothetical protein